jgi:hypothetical protein
MNIHDHSHNKPFEQKAFLPSNDLALYQVHKSGKNKKNADDSLAIVSENRINP